MTVLVFEDNLLWSSRLSRSLKALGHDASVLTNIPEPLPYADVAIVNLGSPKLDPKRLIPLLKEAGIYVIAHAGHKETDLREVGKSLNCDRLASNSELTFKLEELLRVR